MHDFSLSSLLRQAPKPIEPLVVELPSRHTLQEAYQYADVSTGMVDQSR